MTVDFLVPLLLDGVEVRQQGKSSPIQTMLELPHTISFDLVAYMTSAEISHCTEKLLCAGNESGLRSPTTGRVDSLDILFAGGTVASASCLRSS